MSKRQKQRYLGAVQIEQLKLIKIQYLLEHLLTGVNETINSLKVEELQLKSSAVVAMQNKAGQPLAVVPMPGTSLKTISIELDDVKPETNDFNDIANEVNKQEIDLDLFVGSLGRRMEEEEDDEIS